MSREDEIKMKAGVRRSENRVRLPRAGAAGLSALLLLLLCPAGAEASRFRRLAYPDASQYLDGALVAEDSVSYYILGDDGKEKCYSKKGAQIIERTPLEDAEMLARHGYSEEALRSFEAVLESSEDASRKAAIVERMMELAPRLTNLATLQRLAGQYPGRAEAQYGLGRAFLAAGRHEEASEAMLRAAEMDGRRLDYRLGLAEVRLHLAHAAFLEKDLPGARQILAEIPYSASVAEEVRWLARDDFRARLEEPEAEALLRYDPHLFLARYLVESRLHALAGPYLLSASEAHPHDPVVHNYLAHVYLELGRVAEAERQMRQGDANPANHPPFRAQTERLCLVRRLYEAQLEKEEEKRQVAMQRLSEYVRQSEMQKAEAAAKSPPLLPGEVRIED